MRRLGLWIGSVGAILLLCASLVFAQWTGPVNPIILKKSSPVTFVRAANGGVSTSTVSTRSVTLDGTGCNFLVGWALIAGGTLPLSPSGSYAAVSMTAVAGSPWGPNGINSGYILSYILKNPTTGSNTLTISWTGAATRTDVGGQCFSGALGTVSSIQSTATGAPTATSPVSSNGASIVVAAQVNQAGQASTLNSCTTDWTGSSGGGYGESAGHCPGAASVTPTWNAAEDVVVAFNIDN